MLNLVCTRPEKRDSPRPLGVLTLKLWSSTLPRGQLAKSSSWWMMFSHRTRGYIAPSWWATDSRGNNFSFSCFSAGLFHFSTVHRVPFDATIILAHLWATQCFLGRSFSNHICSDELPEPEAFATKLQPFSTGMNLQMEAVLKIVLLLERYSLAFVTR